MLVDRQPEFSPAAQFRQVALGVEFDRFAERLRCASLGYRTGGFLLGGWVTSTAGLGPYLKRLLADVGHRDDALVNGREGCEHVAASSAVVRIVDIQRLDFRITSG